MTCQPHNDERNYHVVGVDHRGYEIIGCRVCRKFIGYRPPGKQQSDIAALNRETKSPCPKGVGKKGKA